MKTISKIVLCLSFMSLLLCGCESKEQKEARGRQEQARNDSIRIANEKAEEERQKQLQPKLPRTFEGVSLGMTESQIKNYVEREGFNRLETTDRAKGSPIHKAVKYSKYRSSYNKEENFKITEIRLDENGKIYKIVLNVAYDYMNDVREQLMERYPLRRLYPGHGYEYTDGETIIFLSSSAIEYTDENYLRRKEREAQLEKKKIEEEVRKQSSIL